MIKSGMSLEEIRAQGAAGRILGLDPPLVMDDFALYYPSGEKFASIPLTVVSKHGIWEPEETRFILDESEHGGIMLDVGAHLGYFGLISSRASGGKMEVHMFEPSKDMTDSIHRSIKYGGFPDNIHVHNNAVGPESGIEVMLAGPDKDSGSSTIVDTIGPNGEFDPGNFSVPFSSTTLRIDDLGLTDVTLVKMDVEGYEYEAWKGMRETIKASPDMTIIMETGVYHPAEFRAEWRESFDEYVFDWDGTIIPAPEGYIDIVPATNAILRKKK